MFELKKYTIVDFLFVVEFINTKVRLMSHCTNSVYQDDR